MTGEKPETSAEFPLLDSHRGRADFLFLKTWLNHVGPEPTRVDSRIVTDVEPGPT